MSIFIDEWPRCLSLRKTGNLGKYEFISDFFHFYFLNINISLTIKVFNLKFAMCVLKYLLKGSLSQIFYLGPSFYFM